MKNQHFSNAREKEVVTTDDRFVAKSLNRGGIGTGSDLRLI